MRISRDLQNKIFQAIEEWVERKPTKTRFGKSFSLTFRSDEKTPRFHKEGCFGDFINQMRCSTNEAFICWVSADYIGVPRS